ncbi:hypothetical protein DL771_006014 [Monosporascus sp. 5C6A]|nr:hypothetical protein DL771_006014 [Monosporascus sp. 5C6A]
MQRSLATSSIECAQLLSKVSSLLLHDLKSEERSTLLHDEIEDQLGRFRVWAGNLGAFQRLPATSSLDHRLRESPKVAAQVQELLQDLQDVLQNVFEIASGERRNRQYEADNDDEFDVQEHEHDDHHYNATDPVENNEHGDGRTYPSEARELFESMKETIASLFRISILIRNASPRDRFAKALSSRQLQFDDSFDISHVGHKFPLLNTKENQWLKERLGRAITHRRQYLRYARDHRHKLSKEPTDLWEPEDQEKRSNPALIVDWGEDSQAGRTNPTKPTSTLAPTTASTLRPLDMQVQEKDFQDDQSQTSYALSLGDDDGESHLQLPRLEAAVVTPTQFRHHVGLHMQQLALFAIPRGYLEDDQDVDPATSVQAVGTNKGESSRGHSSLSSFRSVHNAKPNPSTEHTATNLGSLYANNGQLDEEEDMHRRVLEAREKGLGKEHPDTLTSVSNLASVLLYQAKYEAAEEMNQRALKGREKVLGKEHPDTLTSMAGLALTYDNQGRWKEAEELEVQVVEIKKRVLGEEHPDTLSSMANLASMYGNQGRSKEAEELRVQVAEITKRVLGEEHPDTLTSMANLASTYADQGRWKEAEQLGVQVVEITKRVLGEEHPDTLTSMANLAWTYDNQGRWKEAEELQVQVMEITKRVLGDEHSDTLTSMSNLAFTLKVQGRNDEAISLMEKCVQLQKQFLGPQDPYTTSSLRVLNKWQLEDMETFGEE